MVLLRGCWTIILLGSNSMDHYSGYGPTRPRLGGPLVGSSWPLYLTRIAHQYDAADDSETRCLVNKFIGSFRTALRLEL